MSFHCTQTINKTRKIANEACFAQISLLFSNNIKIDKIKLDIEITG